jgi:biotin synthase
MRPLPERLDGDPAATADLPSSAKGSVAVPTILQWLKETDEEALELLWQRADAVRKATVGDEVHLRGLVEIGNYCVRQCAYCGISACASVLPRYRMSAEEIIACAMRAEELGYGTVVLQSGEDPGFSREMIAAVVREIKRRTALAVTLSLGERSDDDARAWREAGADRYLLRFETSDRKLYDAIHPSRGKTVSDRLRQIERLRLMGYEVGSGVMIGIPGQTWKTLARDIELFGGLDLDMVGVGPYIPSPRTPLAGALGKELMASDEEQVPSDVLTTLKVVALSRIVCPDANIPSTTALATLDQQTGRELGLSRGANVVMPNLTPPAYRVLYEIYPGKACIHETAEACHGCLTGRILRLGRVVGRGQGGRRA